jgi:hypothetical protein
MAVGYWQVNLKVELGRHGRGCEYNIKTDLKVE